MGGLDGDPRRPDSEVVLHRKSVEHILKEVAMQRIAVSFARVRRASERGSTLIELMIAMLILATGLGAPDDLACRGSDLGQQEQQGHLREPAGADGDRANYGATPELDCHHLRHRLRRKRVHGRHRQGAPRRMAQGQTWCRRIPPSTTEALIRRKVPRRFQQATPCNTWIAAAPSNGGIAHHLRRTLERDDH